MIKTVHISSVFPLSTNSLSSANNVLHSMNSAEVTAEITVLIESFATLIAFERFLA